MWTESTWMNSGNESGRIKVVVLGAGFAGFSFINSFIRKLRRRDRRRIDLTVIDGNSYHLFAPLLYQVATGSVRGGHISSSIYPSAESKKFRFLKSTVLRIFPEKNRVITTSGVVSYDYLVVSLGAENNNFGVPGVGEYSVPLKSLRDGRAIRERIYNSLIQEKNAYHVSGGDLLPVNFVIVGGGATGVELAASMSDQIRAFLGKANAGHHNINVILVEAQDRLLRDAPEEVSERLMADLTRKEVKVMLGTRVRSINKNGIELQNGGFIETRNVFWAAGIRNGNIITEFGGRYVEKDHGRIAVDSCLRVPGFGNVFVLGDNSLVKSAKGSDSVPQTAAAAVQEGKFAGKYLASFIGGRVNSEGFRCRDTGLMVATGSFSAVCMFPGRKIITGFGAWIIWHTVHLFKLETLKNRITVMADWILWDHYMRNMAGPRLN